MMRMFCSGRPVTSANTVLIAWGAWLVMWIVALPVAPLTSALPPPVSTGSPSHRGWKPPGPTASAHPRERAVGPARAGHPRAPGRLAPRGGRIARLDSAMRLRAAKTGHAHHVGNPEAAEVAPLPAQEAPAPLAFNGLADAA